MSNEDLEKAKQLKNEEELKRQKILDEIASKDAKDPNTNK